MFKRTTILFITVFFFLTTSVRVEAARLNIQPPSGNFELGQQFQADIILDTENQSTAGTDVYLNYDPTILSVVTIQNGTAYDTYLGKNIDNNSGSLSVSGITSLGSNTGFNGTDTFVTILFEGVGVGTSEVTFDFSPGARNDSNVAVLDTATDELTSATGATYIIGAAGTGSGTGGTGSGSGKGGPVAQTTPTELPQSGVITDTLKPIAAGLGALVLSLLLLL